MRKGWEIKKLGEVCENLDSKRIPITKGKRNEGKYPYYGASGIVDHVGNFIFDEEILLVSEDGANLLTRVYPIAFSVSGKCWVNNHAHVLRFEKKITQSFVEYYLNSIKLDAYISGMAQPKLNQQMLNSIKIPIPSFLEQQQIVSILDEAFIAIDQAKENLQRNLQNAKELFQSELNIIFQNKGKGWVEKKLGDICDVEYGYTDKSIQEGDYRYVRITDIDKKGELILEDKKYIKQTKESESFLINENDLLMARTGATFAKVLLFNDDEPSVFASYLIRIKFKEKIENKLYWYFTKTPNYWEQANSLASGSAQPHFNGAALKQVVFSYPVSVAEQKLLIKKFDKLSVQTEKLESIYQQKLDNLEELKKSILQKAFSGELTMKQTKALA